MTTSDLSVARAAPAVAYAALAVVPASAGAQDSVGVLTGASWCLDPRCRGDDGERRSCGDDGRPVAARGSP